MTAPPCSAVQPGLVRQRHRHVGRRGQLARVAKRTHARLPTKPNDQGSRVPGPGACASTPRAARRACAPERGSGPRAQRLDRDLGEGEEQQAAAVRGHMALLAELLALHGGRLDAMLRQDAAEARVRAAAAWSIR